MSLFDALLHYNFYAASSAGGNFDMRKLMDTVKPNISYTDKARIFDSKKYPDWENTIPFQNWNFTVMGGKLCKFGSMFN